MYNLTEIENPNFIKDLSIEEMQVLAKDIREFILTSVSKTGGHLSSNLGLVDLEIALYKVFDADKIKLLFDVGHQAYTHKILTGRAKYFSTLRKFGGISSFIARAESTYDYFESGHAGTSISTMLGMLLAGEKKRLITVIGDASLVNGVALEGLNHIGVVPKINPIIIFNDNGMGISETTGAFIEVFKSLKKNFESYNTLLKTNFKDALIENDCTNIFNQLGFNYIGPVDGHDFECLVNALNLALNSSKPLIIHLVTKKGYGYKFSENDSIGKYHGVGKFDLSDGSSSESLTYSDYVSKEVFDLRSKYFFKVISPGMTYGSCLNDFKNIYQNDYYDVGITEEHASLLAAGLALNNCKSILFMYSTFSQRAFDYLLNDISRQNLPVVLAVDRAGLVGPDGSTHAGVYDVAMLSLMPNVKIIALSNPKMIKGAFEYALNYNGFIAIRYPRQAIFCSEYDYDYDDSWHIVNEGSKLIIITYGDLVSTVYQVIKENSYDILLVDACVIKPYDEKMLDYLSKLDVKVLVFEEVVESGSLYQGINGYFRGCINKSLEIDGQIKHGELPRVLDYYGYSKEKIKEEILKYYEN